MKSLWIALLLLPSLALADVAPGDKAPPFELADQAGKTVKLADQAGKVVVLEWVNPDCPFSARHMKAGTMSRLADKYRDKGVVWLGINSTHYMKPEDNKKAIAAYSLTYSLLSDSTGEVGKAYGAKTTPHLFIVDKTGKLAYEGAIDDDRAGDKGSAAVNYVDKALGELAASKSVSEPQTKSYGCSVKYAK